MLSHPLLHHSTILGLLPDIVGMRIQIPFWSSSFWNSLWMNSANSLTYCPLILTSSTLINLWSLFFDTLSLQLFLYNIGGCFNLLYIAITKYLRQFLKMDVYWLLILEAGNQKAWCPLWWELLTTSSHGGWHNTASVKQGKGASSNLSPFSHKATNSILGAPPPWYHLIINISSNPPC